MTVELRSPMVNRAMATLARIKWFWRTKRFPIVKRLLDISVVLVASVVALPLFALVALAIKCQDGGPVLFWQQRVGRDGRVFAFPKFRSMRTEAEAMRANIAASNHHGADGVTFKLKADPRVTSVGRWLRRTSIDEAPQLWCVLRGDMTLVGPRPALVGEVSRYSLADRERLSVTPGLTCIWQVSGRSDVPFPKQVEMDVTYIRERSLWTDFKLLLKTLPAVIRGHGAY